MKSKWFEEVRLSRLPMAEIGVAFYIREILGNDCIINYFDAKKVFGENHNTLLGNLQKAGVLSIAKVDTNRLKLTIKAPGDKKRERCKTLVRKARLKLKGSSNEEEK